MNVSYKWLQDYVKTGLTPAELGERFRMTSSEMEGLENWSERFDGLVVGKVTEVMPHPNADRLRIASVSIGKETKTIVCGAPNLEGGQTVIVALPGTTLHPTQGAPFTISESVIRGERSEGMLCGADEIGLPFESDGIMVLESKHAAGTPAASALGLDDTVLDLEITPNRPDLLSYYGLAREVSAFERRPLSEIPVYGIGEIESTEKTHVSVHIEDSKLCQRYSAVALDNVEVTESPRWLQARLLLSGIKPINSVVDITNYVMLELGQPLHAFDLDKLGADKNGGVTLSAVPADTEHTLDVLDGSQRTVKPGDIIIVNGSGKVAAIAGIIGGNESSITSSTRRIVLESATFYGPQIRRTSRSLGLRTEASSRFEKGIDPELTVTALKRAVYLIKQISNASVSSEIADIYPGKSRLERPRIHLSFARVQQILGVHISAAETKAILQKLGFQIPSLTKSSFEAIPPTWRKDVSLQEDVIEELIRIWGMDRLPATLPVGIVKAPQPNQFFEDKAIIRRVLSGLGMHETLHLSFASTSALKRSGFTPENDAIRLQLPLSQETEYLIPSHSPSLLANISGPNLHETELSLFEIGHVFSQPREEQEHLSLVLRTGQGAEHAYRMAKAAVLRVFEALHVQTDNPANVFRQSKNQANFWQKGSTLDIIIQDHTVGRLGLPDPNLIAAHKIRSGKNVLFIEINLDVLLSLPKSGRTFVPPAIFPGIERDLTVIVKKSVSAQSLLDAVARVADTSIAKSYGITTIYTGKPLDGTAKSITIHFTYNGGTRTLEDKEVVADQERIIKELRDTLSAQITE